jgi:hypothetical protein
VLEHLEEHGPSEEEIFKSPGKPSHIASIKKGLDAGTALNSCGVLGDTLSVAMVLRDFLLQLPDPVIPTNTLPLYLEISTLSDPSEKIEAVEKLNSSLPEPHKVLLNMIAHMGGVLCRNPFVELPPARVEKYTNDMAIDLAVVLGPACMRSTALPPDPTVETTAIALFKLLFLNASSSSTGKAKSIEPQHIQRTQEASGTNDTLKLEISQLIMDIISNLDMVKMRVGAAVTFEECTPFVLSIKNVLQNTQQIKPKIVSEVMKVDKYSLQLGGENKLVKAQNAVKVFSDEIQSILSALKHDVDKHSTKFTDEEWKFFSQNLSKTQSILLL